MPIRVNLLAEAQEAEEASRKNPVKRALWFAGFLVALVLLGMLRLGADILFVQWRYNSMERQSDAIRVQLAAETNNLLKIAKIDRKLEALSLLSTNRFLWAPLFNALQKTTVDDIRVIRVSGEQACKEEPARIVGRGPTKRRIPGEVFEKISVNIQAIDTSPQEQACHLFKKQLNAGQYFVNTIKRPDGFVLGDLLPLPGPDKSDPSVHSNTFVLISTFTELHHGQ